MKKNFNLIGMLIFFCIFSLVGCTRKESNEVLEDIDVVSNLIIDRNNDGTEEYKYFKDGTLERFKFENYKGNLRAYNEKSDILVFLSYEDDGYYKLKIRNKNREKVITIDGVLNFIKISDNGNYIFYSTLNDDNIPIFHIFDNTSFENEVFEQNNILVSGNLISFNSSDNIVFYGIDIDKKQAGIFEYDIKNRIYKLVSKVERGIGTHLEILENNKILILKSVEEKNYIELIDVNEDKNESIKTEVTYIEDAIVINDDIYFSAVENEKMNLYKFDNNEKIIKRLTFTFPYSLGRDSRLLEWNDRIYFVDIKGQIYYYDIASKTTILGDFEEGEYIILDK
ncbi:MAG: hypothetical protein ACRCYE_16505 [Sarcina sp.]